MNDAYNVTSESTVWLILISSVSLLLLALPASFLIENYGIRFISIGSGFCFLIGGWVRLIPCSSRKLEFA